MAMKIAVLGAGGLGKAAAKIIGMKKELSLVGICDSKGFLFSEEGLDCEVVANLKSDIVSDFLSWTEEENSKEYAGGVTTMSRVIVESADDSIGGMLKFKDAIDGIFVALPNMPNDFIPSVIQRFIDAKAGVVFTDALKRTSAMELMFPLDEGLKRAKGVYITGCGATPGLLSAAAVIAAQSFIEVEKVDIFWGVGISNWEAYKATIREDIAHLPGYNVEKAKEMSDKEVDEFLDKTDGKLTFHNMEHADDILLERVGVVDSRDKVSVGGVMDTRHAKKPVSTTMTLTGRTFDGKRSSHRFILGDETTMAANVVGPALGYLKRAQWLKEHGIYGMFGSTEFMPCVVK